MPTRNNPLTGILEIISADITTLDTDAIVNAANVQLRPGGGVCGAIHGAAGPELALACQPLAPCPAGEARITPGFGLRARYVIHTVGPVWQGGTNNEAEMLAACYRNSITLAQNNNLNSIAFPAISTGIFGYPEDQAAGIAIATIADMAARFDAMPQIYLCCFSPSMRSYLEEALHKACKGTN
ncbi:MULTISPECIES: macro domain-containing protein [Thalassospira]|uniref:Macro domain-containing protein n=1 Tax=Thalassospira aquimaris TaxID=3037796 RepID=A0ABT6G978_9PROT|nr:MULTISPECIES: macro domain-containing protein [Thalassospira]MDG4718560.1 macro domain-containing protein [Thalassospira sp. FZY0004]